MPLSGRRLCSVSSPICLRDEVANAEFGDAQRLAAHCRVACALTSSAQFREAAALRGPPQGAFSFLKAGEESPLTKNAYEVAQ
jgi:hypothetical protein